MSQSAVPDTQRSRARPVIDTLEMPQQQPDMPTDPPRVRETFEVVIVPAGAGHEAWVRAFDKLRAGPFQWRVLAHLGEAPIMTILAEASNVVMRALRQPVPNEPDAPLRYLRSYAGVQRELGRITTNCEAEVQELAKRFARHSMLPHLKKIRMNYVVRDGTFRFYDPDDPGRFAGTWTMGGLEPSHGLGPIVRTLETIVFGRPFGTYVPDTDYRD